MFSHEFELPFGLLFGQHQPLTVSPVFVFNPELDQGMATARIKQWISERVERPFFWFLAAEMMVGPLGADLRNRFTDQRLLGNFDVLLILQPFAEQWLIGWIVPVRKEKAGRLSR